MKLSFLSGKCRSQRLKGDMIHHSSSLMCQKVSSSLHIDCMAFLHGLNTEQVNCPTHLTLIERESRHGGYRRAWNKVEFSDVRATLEIRGAIKPLDV